MARVRFKLPTLRAAEVEGIAIVLGSDTYQARWRFYGDGLSVLEERRSHGAGWFPWRVLYSQQLDLDEQTATFTAAVEQGFDQERVT
jgi:hypothetical protein